MWWLVRYNCVNSRSRSIAATAGVENFLGWSTALLLICKVVCVELYFRGFMLVFWIQLYSTPILNHQFQVQRLQLTAQCSLNQFCQQVLWIAKLHHDVLRQLCTELTSVYERTHWQNYRSLQSGLGNNKAKGRLHHGTPSGVWGETPAAKRFGWHLSQKQQLWLQQFLWIFLTVNIIVCIKTSKEHGTIKLMASHAKNTRIHFSIARI